MKNPLVWLWALPVGGFLLILFAFGGKVTPIKIAQTLNNQPAGEIQGSFTVGQTFYNPYPGLYKIDVLLATYSRSNTGPVTFSLTSGLRDTNKLATVTFDASEIKDNQFRSFEFPARSDSAGKTYFFYFEAPNARPGNAITVWSDTHNPYIDGAAYLGGQPAENDLTFVAYYSTSPLELADIFLERMAKGKPGIWGSKGFYAAIFFTYLALVGVFFYFLFKLVVTGKDNQLR